MREVWHQLDLASLVRTDVRAVLSALRLRAGDFPAREGGILDPTGIEAVVKTQIPFDNIGTNLAAGHLHALTVSTTHVQSGRTVVFIQTPDGKLPPWSQDPTID